MASTIRKLSVIDSAFLFGETTECPMHVGSVAFFRLPEHYDGDFYTDVRSRMLSRLHKAPTLMWKLCPTPFDVDRPSWIEDEAFDLDRHLFRAAIPPPGDRDAVLWLAGFLHAKLLTRSRPLWEMYVFDGLPNGEVAIYQKLHHSLVDGGAAVAIATVLYDLQPSPPTRGPVSFEPPRARGDVGARDIGVSLVASTNAWYREVLGGKAMSGFSLPRTGGNDLGSVIFDATMHQLEWPVRLAQRSLEFAKATDDWTRAILAPGAQSVISEQFTAPPTPMNVSISSERTFAATTIATSRVKAVAKRAGGTVNDVVLALASGTLRRWLRTLGPLPASSLTAFVPISTRSGGTANNSISGMVTTLATTTANPKERLHAIIAGATTAKALSLPFKDLSPMLMEAPTFGTPVLLQMLATFASRTRMADVMPPSSNLVVSNVLFSRVPFYLDEAELVNLYPISIPVHGMGLNITVHGYASQLDFGFVAGANVVEDLKPFAEYMQKEMRDLEAAFPEPIG